MLKTISTKRVVALAAGIALALSGCGSGSGDAEGDKSPLKIALLASTPDQDPFALPGQVDGAKLAVEDVNAEGGIGGRRVNLDQYRMPIDANLASTNFLKAASTEPIAMLGLPIDSTAEALSAKIGQLGIPFVYSNAVKSLYLGSGKNASKSGFMMRSDNGVTIEVGLTDFLAKNPVKTAGMVCITEPVGEDFCDGATRAFDKAGVEVTSTKMVSVQETDLTNPALAMRGAELVVTGITQAQITTLARALKSNGMEPKMFAPATIAPLPEGGMPTDLYPNLSGIIDCVPGSEDATPAVKAWAEKYRTKFGQEPDFFGALAYDSVMLVAKAAEFADSTEPGKLAEALRTMPAYEGICSVYKSDDQNILNQQSVTVSYDADGELQVTGKVDFR